MRKIIFFSIIMVLLFSPVIHAADFDGWRSLPIRSEEEYNQGAIGGEGMQHPHGIARCFYHPETIYISHDASSVCKSIDSGESWIKCLGKNLPLW